MKYTSKGFCDLHTHTISSGHAFSTITEIAKHASEVGLAAVAMTDHTPTLSDSTHIFHFQNLVRIPQHLFGVRVFRGAEANIINIHGNLDIGNHIISPLEIVIASLHPPTFDFVNTTNVTDTIINTMDNEHVDIIGHPDDGRLEYDRVEVVRHSKATNTLLEINCGSLLPNAYRKNARELTALTLIECKKQDVPIVICSDAHFHTAVGAFDTAFELIDEIGFPYELIANRTIETTIEQLEID